MQSPQPQPTVAFVYVTPPSTRTRPNYAAKTSRALGITQVLLGVALLLLGALSLIIFIPLSYVAHGLWTGILVIIAGSFGIAASGNKSSCFITTFMVMSIIAAIFLVIPIALSVWAMLPTADDGDFNDVQGAIYAICIIMIAVSTIGLGVAIWSSVICCKASCGNQTNQAVGQEQVVQYASGAVGPQHTNMVMDGTPPGYNTGNPIDQKSMPMNNIEHK